MTAITPEMLTQHQETTWALLAEASTVHELVTARVEALYEACDRADDWHPLEDKRGYVQRVLAHGQYPFPNDDNYYEHVTTFYGDVTYTGTWADWAEDGETFERRTAHISVPTWVLTDTDGPDRYRAETQEMVAAVLADQEQEKKLIAAIVEAAVAKVVHPLKET